MPEPPPDTAGTVLACFYRDNSEVDVLIREVTCRPGQAFADVPSHCSLIVPRPDAMVVFPPPGEDFPGWESDWLNDADLYEMVSSGWVKQSPTQRDLYGCVYEVELPDLPACRLWCESNRGRYRWWVDALILVLDRNWIRHSRVPALLKRWHVAVRHICSVDAEKALTAGGWNSPHWLAEQICPLSPNDLLFAVRSVDKPLIVKAETV